MVACFESIISPIGRGGYSVCYSIIFVSSDGFAATEKILIRKHIFIDHPRDFLDKPRLRYSNCYPVSYATPALRAYFGNISVPLYSLVYYSNSMNLFLVDGSSGIIEFDVYPQALAYTVGDVLSYVDGEQFIVAYQNVSGIDFICVYPLYENSTGAIGNDEDNDVLFWNITYAGDVIDIVSTDIDSDGTMEILVENGTELIVVTEKNDTQQSGILYTDFKVPTGVVDRMVVGNFMGDEKPEIIFYDPTSGSLEIWNNSARIFETKIDGSPVYDIVTCELDRDGYVDVFLLTNTTAYFVYNGGVVDSVLLPAAPTSNGLIADVDADGYLEMIFVANDTMYCYQTNFDGIGNTQFMNAAGLRTLSIDGDLDGDGISNADELYKYGTSVYIANTLSEQSMPDNEPAENNSTDQTIANVEDSIDIMQKVSTSISKEESYEISTPSGVRLILSGVSPYAIVVLGMFASLLLSRKHEDEEHEYKAPKWSRYPLF